VQITQWEGRSKVRPRKAVGSQGRGCIDRVLVGEVSMAPNAWSDFGGTYSFNKEREDT
tara:strand:+ start:218 stop:391 length:174 start_codon:yes stop_codon:yes gene_type:complete